MQRKNTILFLSTLICFGCKEFPEEKFNKNDICSPNYLDLLKEDCSEPIKTFLEDNELLILKLKNGEVKNIISKHKNDIALDGIKETYRKISGLESENFSGKSGFIYILKNIKSTFNKNFPKNKTKFDEEQILDIKTKSKIGISFENELWSDKYEEKVKEFYKQISAKIDEIDFIFDPKKLDLKKQILNLIEEFKNFCTIKNKEEFDKKNDFSKDLTEVKGNYNQCFIAELKSKNNQLVSEKNYNEFEKFLESVSENIIKNEIKFIKNKKILIKDEIVEIIKRINLSKFVKNEVFFKKIQKNLNFDIEWIEKKGIRIKSKFDEILFPIEKCDIVDTSLTTFLDCEMIGDINENNVVNNLFKYIHLNNFVDKEGKLCKINESVDSLKNEIFKDFNYSKFIWACYNFSIKITNN